MAQARRSYGTIVHCTTCVDSYVVFGKEFQIRTFNEGAPRYAIMFTSEIDSTKHVRMLAEAIVLNGKVRYICKVRDCYPNMKEHERNLIKSLIEVSLLYII